MSLCRIPNCSSVFSNKVGREDCPDTRRLVNSVPLSVWTHSIAKGELLHTVLDKFSGRVSTVLLKRLQITEAAVFVEEGILIISTFFGSSTDQTTLGNELDIDLYPLTWILHLFIRLWEGPHKISCF